MADEYILRSDDGKLYRVSADQLHANPVAPDDPAAQHQAPLDEAANTLQQQGPEMFACVIAFVHPPAAGGSSQYE